MPDFPGPNVAPLSIHTHSVYSAAADLRLLATSVGFSSLTWVANLVCYIPIYVPTNYPVNRVFWGNGTSAGANHNLGIFTTNGKRIYSTGSTAGSGNSVLQFVTPGTTFVLPRGTYYLAYTCDGTSNRSQGGASTVLQLQQVGVLQQASNFALADPATFATPTQALYPICGITRTQANFPI